jgi:NAD(P)-dependent dehydrogenase (short-subunit alcohol dehydrogenase family)
LAGAKALVVGGTGAIGEEVVQRLSELGAEIMIASRDEERCKTLASRVWATSGYAACENVDLSKNASVHDLASRIFATSKSTPDILVLAAAAPGPGVLWANHLSGMLLARKLVEKKPAASIVAVSSGLADVATPSQVAEFLRGGLTDDAFVEHCASKRAQSEALQQLRETTGARVRLVSPTVTVKSRLVDAQLPGAPADVRNSIQFRSAAEAALPIVDAALRDHQAKNAGRDNHEQQFSALSQSSVGVGDVCYNGCTPSECPGNKADRVDTLTASVRMLELA